MANYWHVGAVRKIRFDTSLYSEADKKKDLQGFLKQEQMAVNDYTGHEHWNFRCKSWVWISCPHKHMLQNFEFLPWGLEIWTEIQLHWNSCYLDLVSVTYATMVASGFGMLLLSPSESSALQTCAAISQGAVTVCSRRQIEYWTCF